MAKLTGNIQYRIGFLKKLVLQVEVEYLDRGLISVKEYIDATVEHLQKLNDKKEKDKNANS